MIRDPDKVAQRMAYMFANPATANLVDTVKDYPGLTSWDEFLRVNEIDEVVTRSVPWVRLPEVKALPSNILVPSVDRRLTNELARKSKHRESLEIKPFSWLHCFGLSDDEVSGYKKNIIKRTQAFEARARRERNRKGQKVVGVERLRQEVIMKPHQPKKKERNIFVLSNLKLLRISFIKKVKHLREICRELYQARNFASWPPGMFIPPQPPIASALEW